MDRPGVHHIRPGSADGSENVVRALRAVFAADAHDRRVGPRLFHGGVRGLEQTPVRLAVMHAGPTAHAAAADPLIPDLEHLHRATGLLREFHRVSSKGGDCLRRIRKTIVVVVRVAVIKDDQRTHLQFGRTFQIGCREVRHDVASRFPLVAAPGDFVAELVDTVAPHQVHRFQRIGILSEVTAHADEVRAGRFRAARQRGALKQPRTDDAATASSSSRQENQPGWLRVKRASVPLAAPSPWANERPKKSVTSPPHPVARAAGPKCHRVTDRVQIAESRSLRLDVERCRRCDGALAPPPRRRSTVAPCR